MSETRVFRLAIDVVFGDCDPAGIVFYPNFYRWFDSSVHALMREIGWGWQRTAAEFDWLGLPIAAASANFLRPVAHGDRIVVESRVLRIADRRIVFAHRVLRGDVIACEGEETRFVGIRHPDDPARVKAIEVPDALRAALGVAPAQAGGG
ncbi:MAG: acyl-CoA thioesterase [Lautropia sp.]